MIALLALTQREALMEIYHQTGGSKWIGASKWNTNATYCTWEGIRCYVSDVVMSINMSKFGLTGQLPDVFQSFPDLKILDIGNNTMTSTFPDSFCDMTKLESFEANHAGLYGNLP